jgi:hypothetical protein
VGSLTSHNPIGLQGLLRGYLFIFLIGRQQEKDGPLSSVLVCGGRIEIPRSKDTLGDVTTIHKTRHTRIWANKNVDTFLCVIAHYTTKMYEEWSYTSTILDRGTR